MSLGCAKEEKWIKPRTSGIGAGGGRILLPAGGYPARRGRGGHAGRRLRTPFPSGTADGGSGAGHSAQLFFAWRERRIIWAHGCVYRRPGAAGGRNEAEPPYRRRAAAGAPGAGAIVRGHGGAGRRTPQRGILRDVPELGGSSAAALLRDSFPGRTGRTGRKLAGSLAGLCPAGAGAPEAPGRIHSDAGLSLSGLPGRAAGAGRAGLYGHQPEEAVVRLPAHRHGQKRGRAVSCAEGHGRGQDGQAPVPDRPEYRPAESHSGLGADEGAGAFRPGQRADGPGKALPGGAALPPGLLLAGQGAFSPAGGRGARAAGRYGRRLDG